MKKQLQHMMMIEYIVHLDLRNFLFFAVAAAAAGNIIVIVDDAVPFDSWHSKSAEERKGKRRN